MIKLIISIAILLKLAKTCLVERAECYGSNFCARNQQNYIKPDSLSKQICFQQVNSSFMMGTDKPVIKSDAEGPAREVLLKPFCMDLTAVSNLQFLQFVKETKYKTEVC